MDDLTVETCDIAAKISAKVARQRRAEAAKQKKAEEERLRKQMEDLETRVDDAMRTPDSGDVTL